MSTETLRHEEMAENGRGEGGWALLPRQWRPRGRVRVAEHGHRNYDATWGPYFIEFKKGKSVWLDLVRYSETLLKTNEDSMKETVTAFFVPSKDKMKIEEIILVETSSIVNALSLDKETAEIISSLNDKLPRSLNAQASLTLGDLRNISINTKLLKAIKAQKIT